MSPARNETQSQAQRLGGKSIVSGVIGTYPFPNSLSTCPACSFPRVNRSTRANKEMPVSVAIQLESYTCLYATQVVLDS